MKVAWPKGYNVEVELIGYGFDSRRNCRGAGKLLEGTMRVFCLLQNLALQLGLGQRCQYEG